MTTIAQERANALLDSAEQAMIDDGCTFTRIGKSKRYKVKTSPDAVPEIWIVRTSTKRDLAFDPDGGRWPTLGDERIDKVLIAAFDHAKHPTAKVVYPPIARVDLLPRFVAAHEKWLAASPTANHDDPRLFVKLDKREGSNAGSDFGSGITEGLTPRSYPLEPHLRATDADRPARPRGRPRRAAQPQEAEPAAPDGGAWILRAPTEREPLLGKSSISMVLDLDEAEQAELAARYAHKLEVDPRRVLVQVRLTVLT